MKFTVVLKRPSRDATDLYVAHVEASDKSNAVHAARVQVWSADKKDSTMHNPPKRVPRKTSYRLIVMFNDWLTPVLFGWQAF